MFADTWIYNKLKIIKIHINLTGLTIYVSAHTYAYKSYVNIYILLVYTYIFKNK